MLGLRDTEIPAGKCPPFAPNGFRMLPLPRDSAAACYLITDLQTGWRRLRRYQTPTGPDAAA
jgi:hypothetical protein